MPNMFGIQWKGKQLNTHVIIHHGDGSVSVAHGGIDIGQGINMKVRIGRRGRQVEKEKNERVAQR